MKHQLLLSICLAAGCASLPQATIHQDIHRGISLTHSNLCVVQEVKNQPITYSYSDGCIHYDAAKMEKLRSKYGEELILAMVAHEAAHASGANEDEADQEAGCFLAQNGIDLGPTIEFWEDRGEPNTRTAILLKGAMECAGAQLTVTKPTLPF